MYCIKVYQFLMLPFYTYAVKCTCIATNYMYLWSMFFIWSIIHIRPICRNTKLTHILFGKALKINDIWFFRKYKINLTINSFNLMIYLKLALFVLKYTTVFSVFIDIFLNALLLQILEHGGRKERITEPRYSC